MAPPPEVEVRDVEAVVVIITGDVEEEVVVKPCERQIKYDDTYAIFTLTISTV